MIHILVQYPWSMVTEVETGRDVDAGQTDVHSGYLILALLGFQFLNFRLKPFVDPMPVEL